jgi:chromosome partitioning protein
VPASQARIIAVANQKGGVGKSTTAVSLGAALAELGHRVLVVDLDPQGNASTGLGIRHEARDVTVYDVLAAEAAIEGAIVATPVPNLYAIPSTIDLAGAEIELVSQFSRELRLRKALAPLKDGGYEFILLDCPPSLGLLTVNALAAAEELIVPIQCEYYALEGLGQLLRNVTLVQQNVNPALRLTGIVMTMYDPRTKLSEQVVEEVRRYFGDRVYDTIIPRTVRLSEAPGFGQPITVYDPKSRGAQCYRELANEVATKLPRDEGLPVIDELPTVIVPPPEPEPARAPRPLVGDAAADGPPLAAEPARAPRPLVPEDRDAAAEPAAPTPPTEDSVSDLEGTEVASSVHDGAGDDRDVTGSPNDRVAQVDVPAPPREIAPPAPEPEVEPARQTSSAVAPEAAPPIVEPEVHHEPVEVQSPQPVEREPSTEPRSVPAPRLDPGRVILIDEEPQPEPQRPMPEPEDEGGTAAPRKRWGLFRRGGDR